MEIKAGSEAASFVLQAAADGRQNDLMEVDVDDVALSQYRCLSGCSALHWAAGHNQLATVRYLVVERNMDVNIRATKKAKDRTPLHYACRNGWLATARLLVELGAAVDAKAKYGVSPFQLAVWQNHLHICRYLVEEKGVDPAELNDFDCGAVHWIGLCPPKAADGPLGQGELLLPMVKWLKTLKGIDFTIRQRQGHSPFHKAAWGAHIALLRWFRDEFGTLDDTPDYAGNYAADLAEMANDERHDEVARWLRRECSSARVKSCYILGVNPASNYEEIRQAYLRKAKQFHPDRNGDESMGPAFDELRQAYEHLTKENGVGKQTNPTHSLKLMLKVSNGATEVKALQQADFFQARLIAVLLEYGDNGLDLSNVRRKWSQVWPNTPCPWDEVQASAGRQRRKGVLLDYIRKYASDIVDVVSPSDGTGSTLVVLRSVTQSQVAAAASK